MYKIYDFIYLLSLLFLANTIMVGQIQFIPPAGGGAGDIEKGQCISDVERSRINEMLDKNIAQLIQNGKIKVSNSAITQKHNFIRPLHQLNLDTYGDVVVSINQVDHDNTSGLLDYNCMEQTYDGHQGTDFGLWPFPWYFYDHNLMEVIAAEDGVIIGKDDGNFDQNCSCIGNWNAVYLRHSDGLITWYGHMKKGLLTSKVVGDSVKQGEFLGYVGSSGCSTHPHLHFEVHAPDGALIDPFKGPCNAIDESYWAAQPEYFEPRVTSVRTHNSDPIHGCPSNNEFHRFADTFDIGEYVYTAAYYSDQMKGDSMFYRIYTPDGVLWKDWVAVADTFYQVAWWYWGHYIPQDAIGGDWRFEVEYYGKKYTKHFYVINPTTAIYSEDKNSDFRIFPNPARHELNIYGRNIKSITLTDLMGRVIRQEKWDQSESKINISRLVSGIYFLSARHTDGSVSVRKMVKVE